MFAAVVSNYRGHADKTGSDQTNESVAVHRHREEADSCTDAPVLEIKLFDEHDKVFQMTL